MDKKKLEIDINRSKMTLKIYNTDHYISNDRGMTKPILVDMAFRKLFIISEANSYMFIRDEFGICKEFKYEGWVESNNVQNEIRQFSKMMDLIEASTSLRTNLDFEKFENFTSRNFDFLRSIIIFGEYIGFKDYTDFGKKYKEYINILETEFPSNNHRKTSFNTYTSSRYESAAATVIALGMFFDKKRGMKPRIKGSVTKKNYGLSKNVFVERIIELLDKYKNELNPGFLELYSKEAVKLLLKG